MLDKLTHIFRKTRYIWTLSRLFLVFTFAYAGFIRLQEQLNMLNIFIALIFTIFIIVSLGILGSLFRSDKYRKLAKYSSGGFLTIAGTFLIFFLIVMTFENGYSALSIIWAPIWTILLGLYDILTAKSNKIYR